MFNAWCGKLFCMMAMRFLHWMKDSPRLGYLRDAGRSVSQVPGRCRSCRIPTQLDSPDCCQSKPFRPRNCRAVHTDKRRCDRRGPVCARRERGLAGGALAAGALAADHASVALVCFHRSLVHNVLEDIYNCRSRDSVPFRQNLTSKRVHRRGSVRLLDQFTPIPVDWFA